MGGRSGTGNGGDGRDERGRARRWRSWLGSHDGDEGELPQILWTPCFKLCEEVGPDIQRLEAAHRVDQVEMCQGPDVRQGAECPATDDVWLCSAQKSGGIPDVRRLADREDMILRLWEEGM